ncbi:hypothetical protein CLOM_g177 [Closterium sp. NIES-68]|nr:hypothetical protein CLOM_g177 [Closterium sp. NIES-68]GJP68072.1 hypothetical protein CLOP_g24823 [Closterium sp. NIES-67]GJP85870.1 hypothetical protein CLOP_g15962 [Closterium sp. NIES-67]
MASATFPALVLLMLVASASVFAQPGGGMGGGGGGGGCTGGGSGDCSGGGPGVNGGGMGGGGGPGSNSGGMTGMANPQGPGLSFSFYSESCPKAADIVAARVYAAFKKDRGVPAPLLRLHFHDCFVQGCDASVLLDSTSNNKAEKDADPNATLGAFDVIDDIKAHLEAECPGTVSCADILALAAREGVHLAGGPLTEVPLGRRDGLTSFALAAETFLPGSTLNVSGLVHNFATVGLDILDVATLSGAHTMGEARCVSLKNRLTQNDPTMNPEFAAYVKAKCGTSNISPKAMINNDYKTPSRFDNQYYKNLLARAGLLTTDQALIYNRTTMRAVKVFAKKKSVFFKHFRRSVMKMGMITPLTGSQGQIRSNCHRVNA